MTEKQAITKLSELIMNLSYRCSQFIGVQDYQDMVKSCASIIREMSKPAAEPIEDHGLTLRSTAWEAYKKTYQYETSEQRLRESGIKEPYATNIIKNDFDAGWNAAEETLRSFEEKPPAIPVDEPRPIALSEGKKIALAAMSGREILREEKYGCFKSAKLFFRSLGTNPMTAEKFILQVSLASQSEVSELIHLLQMSYMKFRQKK